MRRYVLRSVEGQAEKAVELENVDQPSVGSGDLLIRVRACSLNYRDLLMKRGLSASGGDEPVVPLSDGAGEIVEVGSNVEGWAEGDRVALTFFRDWESGPFSMRYHKAARGGSCDGVLTEYVSVPAHSVVKIPDSLSYSAAACLPCAYLTAWQALMERPAERVGPGRMLLCLGTGGVSIAALQIAKAAGAEVIITSSSDEKRRKAEALRADHTISYVENPDWDRLVHEITEKQGADQVIEVGGAGTLGCSMNSVRAGGTISLIGVLTGFQPPEESLFPLVAKAADLQGIYVGSREMFTSMIEYIVEHRISPVIDCTFGFEEAVDAYEYLESARHFGKVVIKW